MERYHKTAGDPPRRDIDGKRQEAEELGSLVEQFLADGGQIEQVGYRMREKPDTFVINPMNTPVYNGALAAEQPIRAKPTAPRAAAAVPKPLQPTPAPRMLPLDPGLDKKAWLIGMLKTQALIAEQTFKLARELGIGNAELRRLGRRHGLPEVLYGAR
ncbi:hypothetical protein [Pseudomonas sp. 273]|uniref:hypothetical protein n=1 Tax=Pseudomonas sp. 273 TaxID=75692 RepID=UPI0023D81E67|nr:hypothetical protein [Pseudomonas sp. 273]